MADEIRTTNQTGTHTQGAEIARNADVEATITPERAPAMEPQTARTLPSDAGDPNTARAQIEQTRARMSETIDEIEEVLVRKKERLQDRLDVFAPVRERPLAAAGAVFGAGLLLGLLTGGGGDSDRLHDDFDDELEERAGTWERRARRLLRIAREQEEELAALSAGRGRRAAEAWDDEETASPSGSSGFDDELMGKVADFVTQAVRGMFGTGSSSA